MTTFVLVHGAWHGGWCWKRVRKLLQAQGHEVFAPSLSGLADRSHLLSPSIDLMTHVQDIANLIRWEELSDVVLCGHSYGGCVISGAAAQVPDRISALVYLDAIVLESGQSAADVVGGEVVKAQLQAASQCGDGWRLPPIPAATFGVNAADRTWVDSQCTPHSAATMLQRLEHAGTGNRPVLHSYILASGYDSPRFRALHDQARARGWRTLEIACGHDVMVDEPEALTAELLAIAAAARV